MILGWIIVLFLLIGIIYVQLDTFGGRFTRKIKKELSKSPNFNKGQFQNLVYTPNFAEGVTIWQVIKKNFKKKNKDLIPKKPIPAVKINLNNHLTDFAIWLGHSSLYLNYNNVHFLVDPVKTVYAAPLKGVNKSFKVDPSWQVEDFKQIDVVLITHDHYDHLDRQTIKRILKRHKEVKFYVGLGVKIHLIRWGVSEKNIFEMDWWDTIELNSEINIHFLPTRHFSGRKWYRNNTLWGSFMLISESSNIYIGGDSGYGSHFKEIARRFPKIDLAFLEMGQYHQFWPYIHMFPQEVHQAATDLKAKTLIPIHHSMFALSDHTWNEPLLISETWENNTVFKKYIPLIGSIIPILKPLPQPIRWWHQ